MEEKIGKYIIEEKIGVGGFGVVYKGKDPYIKRAVAIKTCQVDEEEIRKRFFREAELAGNLRHPNITTIYDFGIHEGIPYIVLEFLTGEDLDKKIKRGEDFSLEEKLRILIEVCKGLHYAHENNIIHRDIKPANVRIQDDGSVKIMDFGIAKSTHMESHLTQTGMTLGTAAYLAPEQIKGEKLDRRTDIFSFGVLMYEFFTLRKPFHGEIITNIIYNILNSDPPKISSLVPGFPEEIEKIVFKCLEKDKEKRYQTVQEIQFELEKALKNLQKGTIKELQRPTIPVTPVELEKTAKTPTLGLELKKKKNFVFIFPILLILFLAIFLFANLKQKKKELRLARNIKVLNPLKLGKIEEKIIVPENFPPIPEEEKKEEIQKPVLKEVPVTFYSNMSPCRVYVNGNYIGTFPPEIKTKLPTGRHEVLFKTDYYEEKKIIFVEEKSENRFGHLFPRMGKLQIITPIGTPYGSVYIDGKYIGDTPITGYSLPVGMHKAEIKRPGYKTIEKEIEIKEGEILQWTVTLLPE